MTTAEAARSRHSSLSDGERQLAIKLADEQLLTGHVLTAVSGWGPEIEINLALSSIGQDELGHARMLYRLAVGDDRTAINDLIYTRSAADFQAASIATVYTEEWERLVVKEYLFETADRSRSRLLAQRPAFSSALDKMKDEEDYHLDFWTAWLRRTAQGAGRDAVQQAVDELWPLTPALFDLPGVDGVADVEARWRDEVHAELALLSMEPSTDGVAYDAARDLAQILSELHAVYDQAPGNW